MKKTGDPASPPTPAGTSEADRDIVSVSALGDPLRRALYRYVVAQTAPVNRDQVATAVGVAHHTAKFHLGRLANDGLLDVEYARPPGRRGPGAGRPTKLFRRSTREVAVSLPGRRYDLAGRLLARAVTDAKHDNMPISDALASAARDWGQTLADHVRRCAGTNPTRTTLLTALTTVLGEGDYEPRPDDGGLSLANCPFHTLAQQYTDLVCGMNLDLLSGLIESLDQAGLEARLDPAPGRCCVRILLATTERLPQRRTRPAAPAK